MPPEEKDFVKMTIRVPSQLSEAIDKAVELDVFASKNEFVVEAIRGLLRALSLAISIQVKARKRARGDSSSYYKFLAEELEEAIERGCGEAYIVLVERLGVVMGKRSIEEVEGVGEEIFELISVDNDVGEEYAAKSGDAPCPGMSPPKMTNPHTTPRR